MKITQTFLTNNNCYKKGQKITVKGIMLHSTACKGVPASNFVKSWNVDKPNGISVCVHAFVDLTGIYQTLPWNYQGWHAGGNANNELIGFEICEPKDYADKEYFKKIKSIALDLCTYLCQEYGLNETNITSHVEGYKKKGKDYASNHSDLDHWWLTYHNYSIDDFRRDLKQRLEKAKNNIEFKTGKEALDYLVAKERITDPEYWSKVLDTTRNTEYLFIKWAKDVFRLLNENNQGA